MVLEFRTNRTIESKIDKIRIEKRIAGISTASIRTNLL